MKPFLVTIAALIITTFANAQAPDASLPFPLNTPATGSSVNVGFYNQVTYNHNGASSSSSSYANCAGFASGNTMRISSNTMYFEVNAPNGYINKIELRLQSNSTTASNAIVAFSTNGVTWTNFSELAMPSSSGTPSCSFHTVTAPATAKFFRIMRVAFGGYVPVGTVGQTVRIFEMHTYVNAISPTIVTSTNTLTGFSQISSPSASQSYTVSGSSLTGSNVVLNAPAGYQISTNNTTWSSTLSLPASGGIITGQPRTIYVRLNDNVAGAHTGNITHTSTGATQVDVALTGNTVITPLLIVNPSSLNFGYVYQGSFSAEQTYSINGLFLSPAAGNITLVAPAGYQITTTSGTGYATSLNLPYTGGTLNATTIYVRFFPPTNGIFNGNVTNAGGSAPTVNVVLNGTGTLLSPSAPLTNMGIDFWTGFGYHQRMQSSSGSGAALSLYISAQQATTVRVSIPGIADPTFPKTVSIPANSAVEVTGFPTGSGNVNNTGNGPDSRLYFTGITPRGIHIESLDGVPVAAYEHTYGTDCAGATLLLPTNTWGATYNVLSLGGTSNTGIPNSFFFVMAKDDNTQIQITPTADIIDSSAATLFSDATPAANILYPAGVPFTITLNKGQIFNAMSRIVGSGSNSALGQDLTGTLIKTIDCQNKKIAVWGGNGRTFMNTSGCGITSGSDNLIQQMLPKVAWGTKYLSTPTKTMEYGIYRIYVSSPSTQVKLNGAILPAASLINNFYYQIESNQPCKIEGDKPINVSQFVVTANCKSAADGNNATSDPEMILLSPVQQSIKNASVYSPSKLNIIASGGSSYINVVLKNGGTAVSSFRLDGLNVCDTGATSFTAGMAYQSAGTISIANAFKPHPQDANYVYAKFKVPSGVSHNIICDSGFNAIAYGLVNGESYGYNAGTALKDLSAIIQTHNPYDTVPGSKTCKGNPNTMEIALPYFDAQIDSIKWDASTNNAISPNGIFWDTNPTPIRTFVQDEITYNVYQMPTALVFNAPGIYRLYATVYGTFSSECGSTQVVPIDMEVVQDTAKFNFVPVACGSSQVTFTDISTTHSGGSISQWLWNFGDATTSNVQNPPIHTYPAASVYNATLRIINEIGCYTDTTRTIDLTGGLTAKFGINPTDTICAGNTITFNDLSTSTGINGAITLWKWNFGEGAPVNATTNANQTHTYNTPGTFTVTLQVQTANGCLSLIMDTNIVVKPNPIASFTNNAEACANTSVSFTNTSTITSGSITSWSWNFGDPASGANNTSSLQNPTHIFSGTGSYTVTLTVQSALGCSSTSFTNSVFINQLPTASFSVSSPTCAGQPVTFTSTAVANSGTLTEWQWDFGDGSPIVILFTATPFTHTYSPGGTYTATLKVKTNKGCFSTVFSLPINIRATPAANFTLPANLCLPNATHTFVNTTTINDGTIATVTYLWDFGDGTATSTVTNPTHTFPGVGPYNVVLTATSNNGCVNSITKPVNTIFAQPSASFTAPLSACNNTVVTFTSTSTAAGSAVNTYSWNFGDIGSGLNNTSSLQNPTHTFSGTGSFTVSLVITNTQGCSSGAAFTQNITINAIPLAPTVTTPVVYCQNATAIPLTATGANLLWYTVPTNGTSSATAPTPLTTTAGSTIYYVSQTVNGCEGPRAAITVNVTGTPAAPVVTSPVSFCQNTTATALTATGSNLLWYNTISGGIGNVTAPVPSTTTVGNTSYFVSQSVNTCEGPRAEIVVNIIPTTTAPIVTTPVTYCQNAVATALTATGTSLLWYNNFSGGVGSTTAPTPNTSTPGSTNFYVSQTGVCGEGPRALIVVTINASPTAAFSFPTVRCASSAVNFTDASSANSGTLNTWAWNFGDPTSAGNNTSTLQNPSHNFVGAGTYTVTLTVTNSFGCVSTIAASQNIVINPVPVAAFTTPNICIPTGAAQFNDISTITSGSINNWLWNFGDGTATSPLQNPLHTYTTGGIKTVTLTVTSAAGCSATATNNNVSVYNAPTSSYTITNTGSLCSNTPLVIKNTSTLTGLGSINNVQIFWDYLNDITNTTSDNSPVANANYSHTYPAFGSPLSKTFRVLIRCTSGTGCNNDYFTDVVILAAPVAQLNNFTPVCLEVNNVTLTQGSNANTLVGIGVYSGMGITSSPTFVPANAGVGTHVIRYTYTATNGCSSFTEKNIVVNATPTLELGPTRTVIEGDILTITPTNINGAAQYLWTPSTYFTNATNASIAIVKPTNDITYKLTVTSGDGCSASDDVFVKVIRDFIVPNTFTPNNDGVHDFWDIQFLQLYPNHTVQVFTRTGQKVFESKNYSKPWDGNLNGKSLPIDTYYYIIDLDGIRPTKKGFVTIIK